MKWIEIINLRSAGTTRDSRLPASPHGLGELRYSFAATTKRGSPVFGKERNPKQEAREAPGFWKRLRRKLFRFCLFVVFCLLGGITGVVGIDVFVGASARGRIFAELDDMPARPVAVV